MQVDGVFAGHTALQAASQNGHEDVVKILIRHNADLETQVTLFVTSFPQNDKVASRINIFI